MTDSYAVIKTGGKQYRVREGERLKVEKLAGDEGGNISFDEVLLTSNEGKITVGSPLISGASVKAEIISHGRAKKINIIKLKRRKHYRRQAGHRQHYSEVKITAIA